MLGETGIEILDKPVVGDFLLWEILSAILIIWYVWYLSYTGRLGPSYQTTRKDPLSSLFGLNRKDSYRSRR
jgi:hypothetical protein